MKLRRQLNLFVKANCDKRSKNSRVIVDKAGVERVVVGGEGDGGAQQPAPVHHPPSPHRHLLRSKRRRLRGNRHPRLSINAAMKK